MYPAFGLSVLDRAVKECLGEVRCRKSDLKELREYFRKHGGLRCVYCGDHKATRWDHVHPVSKGGGTVKGNLAPACASCDDSKQDRTLDEWYKSKTDKRPDWRSYQRAKRIIATYRGYYKHRPKPFLASLNASQRKTYHEFRRQLAKLREFLRKKGLITGRGL
jgi:hypothetical protein